MLTLLQYDQVVKTNGRGSAAVTWYTIKASYMVERLLLVVHHDSVIILVHNNSVINGRMLMLVIYHDSDINGGRHDGLSCLGRLAALSPAIWWAPYRRLLSS